VIACDGQDGVLSDAFVTDRVSRIDLLRAFGDRVRLPSTILAAQGPVGPFSAFARSIGGTFCGRQARRRGPHDSCEQLAIATASGQRFCAWLRRFCGVATKYLRNYLGWRRLLERQRPPPAELVALGWSFEPQRSSA
jgi:hypothetical protein